MSTSLFCGLVLRLSGRGCSTVTKYTIRIVNTFCRCSSCLHLNLSLVIPLKVGLLTETVDKVLFDLCEVKVKHFKYIIRIKEIILAARTIKNVPPL